MFLAISLRSAGLVIWLTFDVLGVQLTHYASDVRSPISALGHWGLSVAEPCMKPFTILTVLIIAELCHQLVTRLCILWERETSLLDTVRETKIWQRRRD